MMNKLTLKTGKEKHPLMLTKGLNMLSSISRKLFIVFCFYTVLSYSSTGSAGNNPEPNKEKTVQFFVIADIGRNGYYKQKEVAKQMGILSESMEPDFIISSGDCFHLNGIKSIQDPMWISNYENIYTHPYLHCDWYPVLGNHEYHGNTQAVIDYSNVSRRWHMPSRYYTMVKKVNDSTSLRMVFIDTPAFVEKYRKDTLDYPDLHKQDLKKQITWIDSVLASSKETWKIVVGHHPVISIDKKHGDTPELIEKLNPLLKKYKVDLYFSGHIHNFQHLRVSGSDLDYVITSSGSLARPAFSNDSTRFSSPDEGFTVCSVTHHRFEIRFVNYKGKTIYQYGKEQKE